MVAHLQDALAAAVADPDACTARCLARLAEEESSRAAIVARRSVLLCGGPSGQRGHPAQRLAGPGSAGKRRGGRAAILAQARVTKSCSLPRRHHRGHSAQRPDLTTLIRLAERGGGPSGHRGRWRRRSRACCGGPSPRHGASVPGLHCTLCSRDRGASQGVWMDSDDQREISHSTE